MRLCFLSSPPPQCSPAWKALLDDAAERLALFTAPPPPYRRLMTACQPVLQQSAADAWGASLQEASVEADQMMS